MIEEWRDIKGYEGYYQVSNMGRVRSLDRIIERPHPRKPDQLFRRVHKGTIMKRRKHEAGYWMVDLYINNIQDTRTVHRLVAEAFIPNPDNLPEVNHIDEDKSNNIVTNLEWVTRLGNVYHGTGLQRMGQKHWTPVIQMTLDGKDIKRWECAQHAADALNIYMTHIISCCRGKSKTHGGYRWRYDK